MDPQELLDHADFVHALAFSLISDIHQASDIEQQTWLVAIENPPASAKPSRLWLSKVTRNIARMLYRSEIRKKKREMTAEIKQTSSPDEVLEREEIRRCLIKEVISLPDPYRKAIIHRYYDGLQPREIARHLDIPVERVWTHLKRGLTQLRGKLDDQHGGRERWLMALAPVAG
ncbi:MAG: sigma-70 family RNA polymerase sigma factor, partial [Planctomycetota bacterium]